VDQPCGREPRDSSIPPPPAPPVLRRLPSLEYVRSMYGVRSTYEAHMWTGEGHFLQAASS
jgi:hypothetical protein